jgi:hypothetical protein
MEIARGCLLRGYDANCAYITCLLVSQTSLSVNASFFFSFESLQDRELENVEDVDGELSEGDLLTARDAKLIGKGRIQAWTAPTTQSYTRYVTKKDSNARYFFLPL